MTAICVECVSFIPRREWCFLYIVSTERCAHPENMIKGFDYVTGKAKLAHCYKYNRDCKCEHFIKRSGE